jgi:hypothetical protein
LGDSDRCRILAPVLRLRQPKRDEASSRFGAARAGRTIPALVRRPRSSEDAAGAAWAAWSLATASQCRARRRLRFFLVYSHDPTVGVRLTSNNAAGGLAHAWAPWRHVSNKIVASGIGWAEPAGRRPNVDNIIGEFTGPGRGMEAVLWPDGVLCCLRTCRNSGLI